MKEGHHRVYHALDVELCLIVHDERLKQRLTAQDAFNTLEREEQLIDNVGLVGFNVAYHGSFAELQERLDRVADDGTPRRFIIVSDRLTESDGDRPAPNSVATELREWFDERPLHLGGTVALIHDRPQSITDINQAIDMRGLSPERLKDRICAVANGLWLKSKVNSKRRSRKGIRIHAVHTQRQMKGCLRLRHKVYDAMGYLDAALANAADIEVDSFDRQAFHFVALDNSRVAGTVRLVTTVRRARQPSIIGIEHVTLQRQTGWIKKIIEGDHGLMSRFKRTNQFPFPILQNSNFGDRWPEVLDRYELRACGEVSRVVVSPRYRGLGISHMLMRAAIATAVGLGKKHLLLECIPAHIGMYGSYGFKPLAEGNHCRYQELDTTAIGMQLGLTTAGMQNNEAVAFAGEHIRRLKKRDDPKMLAGPDTCLCVCHIRSCWKDAQFRLMGKRQCPLRHFHLGIRR